MRVKSARLQGRGDLPGSQLWAVALAAEQLSTPENESVPLTSALARIYSKTRALDRRLQRTFNSVK
ncbi:hypothetical protein ACRRTK_009908 [Alexandromys fortis]